LEDIQALTPSQRQLLKEKEIDVYEVAMMRTDELAAILNISFVKAKQIHDQSLTLLTSSLTFKTAEELANEQRNRIRYSTGSSNLDNILGGGVECGNVLGLTGAFSVGKTQIAFSTLVSCLQLGRKVVFIETEPNTFNMGRIKEIANYRRYNDLSGIKVITAEKIPNVRAQYLCYEVIRKDIEAFNEDIGLVIVDSFTAKFRNAFPRRELLPLRTREFAMHFDKIHYLAAKYNIAWILTCQVMGLPDTAMQFESLMRVKNVVFPYGGHYLLHSVGTWVSLKQVKSELWEATVFDSSYLPVRSCIFKLTKRGVENP